MVNRSHSPLGITCNFKPMNRTLPFFLALALTLAGISGAGQKVSVDDAVKIAGRHMATLPGPSGEGLKSSSASSSAASPHRFSLAATAVRGTDTLYYVLNDSLHNDFVILAADRRCWPVLGYSTAAIFPADTPPEPYLKWMEAREVEISHIISHVTQPDVLTALQWEALESSAGTASTATVIVGPLLSTTWNQGCYYNSLCPEDPAGPCGHAVTGCTATAMAQLMKYWNFPTTGTGSESYLTRYGQLSADFGGTTYLWNQMSGNLTSENEAVATLMYHCGVALNMNYGPTESGASGIRDPLVNYFRYSPTARQVSRSDFSDDAWTDLIRTELEEQRPVFYQGFGVTTPGHAFVCDGFDDAGYFHFNWGWGGAADGYFYLNNLNPYGYDFNIQQGAVVQIFPSELPMGFLGMLLSSSSVSFGASGGEETVTLISGTPWSATADQPWVSLSAASGDAGKSSLTITASENNGTAGRTALVTLTPEDGEPTTILVNQIAYVTLTAGGLKSALSDILVTVKYLSVKGTIDARDIRVMRDEMPLLSVLDLRDAVIVEYTGTEGTAGVTEIAYPSNTFPANAFYNLTTRVGKNSLIRVTLPSSLLHIDQQAFVRCKMLRELNFPESLVSIGDETFVQCEGLESLVLPVQLQSIGNSAFAQCVVLKSVLLPASLSYIGNYAFKRCPGLDSLFIPASVETIGFEAFGLCSALISVAGDNPVFSSSGGILYDKNQTFLIQCPVSLSGDLLLPASVVTIGTAAFSYCSLISSVAFPEGLTSIGNDAFWCCYALKTISLPQGIQSLGVSAFGYCNALETVYSFSMVPPPLAEESYVFYNIGHPGVILYVPFGSANAYQAASQWRDFDPVVEMEGLFFSPGEEIFTARGGSREIQIASSGNWSAFSPEPWLTLAPASGGTGKCTLLLTAAPNETAEARQTTVAITGPGMDSGTIEVHQYPTIQVTSGNLETLLAGAAGAITHLTLKGTIDARDVRFMRDNMPLLEFLDLSGTTIVAYSGTEGPAGTDDMTYPAHTFPAFGFSKPANWEGSRVLKEIIFPDAMTRIDQFAFMNCSALCNVTFSPSLLSIGMWAFYACREIKKVEFPDSLVSLESGVFIACNGLTQVTLPEALQSLGGSAFRSCQNLESFSIPASVTSIGTNALAGCAALKTLWAWPVPPVDLAYSPGVFDGVDTTTCILYVPPAAMEAYRSALQWRDFWNITAIAPLTLELSAGWNIISMHTLPENRDALTFFQPLITAGTLLTVQDEAGHTLEDMGDIGTWANSVGELMFTDGYKVRVSFSCSLPVYGTPAPLPLDIPLAEGWNIIAFPLSSAVDARVVVQELIDRGTLMKVQDENGHSLENRGLFGGWHNSIGPFLPGKGYRIRVTSPEVLTIRPTY